MEPTKKTTLNNWSGVDDSELKELKKLNKEFVKNNKVTDSSVPMINNVGLQITSNTNNNVSHDDLSKVINASSNFNNSNKRIQAEREKEKHEAELEEEMNEFELLELESSKDEIESQFPQPLLTRSLPGNWGFQRKSSPTPPRKTLAEMKAERQIKKEEELRQKLSERGQKTNEIEQKTKKLAEVSNEFLESVKKASEGNSNKASFWDFFKKK